MALTDLLTIAPEQLLYGLLLPFLLIFAITFGVLSSLRVFNKKINIVVSLILTLLVTSSPQFGLFATYIAQLGAQVVLVMFGLLFGFGVIVWAIGRGRDIYHDSMVPSRREGKILERMEKIDKKLARTRGEKRKALLEERRELEDELRIARAERKY